MDRGQLSISVIEAGLGVVLLFAVTMGFTLGLPTPNTETEQLDVYAEDVATVLANEPPRHGGETRLDEVVSSDAGDREYDALATRTDRILEDNQMYRLELPHGTVGYERPAGKPAGRATIPTAGGEVTVWIWYV